MDRAAGEAALGARLVVHGRVDVRVRPQSRTARGTRARRRACRAGSHGPARRADSSRQRKTSSPRVRVSCQLGRDFTITQNSMPLVLFASYSGALGGAEQVLIDFASALDAEVCLACPQGPMASEALQAGFRVFSLPSRSLDVRTTPRDRAMALPRLAAHGIELHRLAQRLRPDVVVLWGMRSAIAAGSAGSFGCPVVFAHHDLLPGPVLGRPVRRAALRADRVVAASHTVARDVDRSGQLGPKLVVIYPGVDMTRFAAVDGGRVGARSIRRRCWCWARCRG